MTVASAAAAASVDQESEDTVKKITIIVHGCLTAREGLDINFLNTSDAVISGSTKTLT